MASTYDFFIGGDHENGKRIVADALRGQGFEVTSEQDGNWLARRGSAAKTFWLGGMAGKGFQITFPVQFFVDQQGYLVVRVSRDMGMGALKGGAIGASKTDTVFVEVCNALGGSLTDAGVLASSVSA
jgi:hypothetical protein